MALSKEEKEIVQSQMDCLKALAETAKPLLKKAGIAYKVDAITKLADDICTRVQPTESESGG